MSIYVNERYCHTNNKAVKCHLFSRNVEILIAGLRPCHLPREFSHVIVYTLHVPHRNVSREASLELAKMYSNLEISTPDALTVISCNSLKSCEQ